MRDWLRLYGPGALLVLAGILLAYQFVPPSPPKHIVIATGDPRGAYYAYAERYRAKLAQSGVTLEIRATQGTGENLRLLQDPASGVDLAFAQGGVTPLPRDGGREVRALASVFLEPLWTFTIEPDLEDRLRAMRGKRLAIGAPDSGTRQLMDELIRVNRMDDGKTELLPIGGGEATAALTDGRIDAAFLVNAADSALVNGFLAIDGVRAIGLTRAPGLAQRYRFLRYVTLYEGALDFGRNIPDHNITMVAPEAALVTTTALHPALVDLLLETAIEVHADGDLFAQPGEFPTAESVAIPLIDGARDYLRRGPSFLQRWLPFWAATLIDRMLVLAIPLLTLLIPLARLLPPIIDWRMKGKVFRWYKELRKIEQEARTVRPEERGGLLQRLDTIDDRMRQISVPAAYGSLVFTLRQHLELIRERLEPGSSHPIGHEDQGG